MSDDDIGRRHVLKALGAGAVAGLAGCVDDVDDILNGNDTDHQKDDKDDSDPDPTPEETETPEDTDTPEETPTPEENSILPDDIDEESWEQALESTEDSVLTSEDSFLEAVTEDGELTDDGRIVAEVITDDEVEDIQREIAEAVTQREELDQYDIGILTSLTENPEVYDPDSVLENRVPMTEVFKQFRLDRADENLTEIEKRSILGLENPENEIPEEVLSARNFVLINREYSQDDVEFFNQMGEYIEETLNAPKPRIEQIQDEDIISQVTNNAEVEQLLEQAEDSNHNGIINARDPSDSYSATPDQYGTGLLMDLFDLDPERPVIMYLFESTSDANQEMVDHALEFMPEMYQGDGFQTILIEGRQNLQPFPDDIEGGDKIREIASPISDIFVDLPCHYLIFAEYDTREGGTRNYGLNGDVVLGRDPNYALVNVDPVVRASENWDEKDAVEWTVMAETFDAIYDRDLRSRIDDWYRKWPEDGLSDDGKKSYSSWGYLDEGNIDRKGMLDVELEMVLESNFGHQIPSSRVDEVRDYQRKLLAENEDPDFQEDEFYLKRLKAEELGLEL